MMVFIMVLWLISFVCVVLIRYVLCFICVIIVVLNSCLVDGYSGICRLMILMVFVSDVVLV